MTTTASKWDRIERLLDGLGHNYTHAIVAFLDRDGYPLSVATGFEVDLNRGVVTLDGVAGAEVAPPIGPEVNLVFSHIRPQPGVGYDERRYVSLWGTLRAVDGGRLEFVPGRVQHWDEQEMPFFEFSERGVPQAHRYMDKLSEETGRTVKPRLSAGWLFLRATRLPFLSATVVPILAGVAVAARHHVFSWWLALLTVIGGACVHLALNVTNDIFDTRSGADDANVNPTQFSGGSRVIVYGLLSMRQMIQIAAGFYVVGLGIGLYLAISRAFVPLLLIGMAGFLISVFYTAPPLKLVHRGLGEIATFLGFGPIMTLGAFYVQAKRFSWEAVLVSIPIGILVALILYVNEIPDRAGDAAAGKRTLPVRWSKELVIAVYGLLAAGTFGFILVASVAGWIARPTLIALAGIPLALTVYRGLKEHYDSPYTLMAVMGKNIQLHAMVGSLLFVGYLIATIASHLSGHPPVFLR